MDEEAKTFAILEKGVSMISSIRKATGPNLGDPIAERLYDIESTGDGYLPNIPARYKSGHARDSPSRLRRQSRRPADHPLTLRYGPAQISTAKHRDDMDKVDGRLITLHVDKACLTDRDHTRLAGRRAFALR